MLKIGTELVRNSEYLPKAMHVIKDIRVTEDGTLLYRADPYQVYHTEKEIRKEFLFVRPVGGLTKRAGDGLQAWLKKVSSYLSSLSVKVRGAIRRT